MPKTSRVKTIGEIGEFALIDLLTKHAPKHRLIDLGIGDDAALMRLPKGHQMVVTADIMAEGVHFRMNTTSPDALGHKLLAVNLSDIAAMGAKPIAAIVSMSLPKSLPTKWIKAVYRGMQKLADQTGTVIAGGDTTGSSGPVTFNVTLLGHVASKSALRRSGASKGDSVWLAGVIGHSRAGFASLEANLKGFASLKNAHLKPKPLLEEGKILAASGKCTSCIDVSDGLAGDLVHICEQSGVGAVIESDCIPISPALRKAASKFNLDPLDFAIYGGEDYALLFTLRGKSQPPRNWPSGKPVKIGDIIGESWMWIRNHSGEQEPLHAVGWDHFKA